MKKFYFLIVLLFMGNGVMAQWFQQNSGTTYSLLSVYFTDINIGYVVGVNGTILKTMDGGENWDAQNSGTTIVLRSIYFPNDSTGFAVGDNGTILKTSDGGINWSPQNSGTLSQLHSVYFTDVDTGYSVGDGVILKTMDGGSYWDMNYTVDGYLLSVHFPSPEVGYVEGHTYLYPPLLLPITLKTVDGGENWTQINLPCFIPSALYFINVDTGFIVGTYNPPQGLILKTMDGGTSWTLQTGDYDMLHSVYFPDSFIGYAVGGGDYGLILKTNDGGTNWYEQESSISYGLISVYFLNNDTGYVVGNGGIILKTINGGNPVGIKELSTKSGKLKLFPNPTSTDISIKSPVKGEFIILDLSGKQLMQLKLTETTTTIDVSTLSSGIYFVRVIGENGVIIDKMLKK